MHYIDYCSFNIYTKGNKAQQMRITGEANLSVKKDGESLSRGHCNAAWKNLYICYMLCSCHY